MNKKKLNENLKNPCSAYDNNRRQCLLRNTKNTKIEDKCYYVQESKRCYDYTKKEAYEKEECELHKREIKCLKRLNIKD
jgi:hypothetical protein